MDTLIINPTRGEMDDAINAATADANKGRRSRTVEENMAMWWSPGVLSAGAGHVEDNGGGVANSYGYAADSSALAVAWATDAAGNKHVRVISGRQRCSGKHVKTLLPGTRADQKKLIGLGLYALLVYPELFAVYGSTYADEGFRKAIHKKPGNMTAWAAYADWLEEQGKVELCGLIRSFFGAAVGVNQ